MLTNKNENFNREFKCFSGNTFVYQFFVGQSSHLPIIEKWRRKNLINAVKANNWTDVETAPLCEITVSNGFGFMLVEVL